MPPDVKVLEELATRAQSGDPSGLTDMDVLQLVAHHHLRQRLQHGLIDAADSAAVETGWQEAMSFALEEFRRRRGTDPVIGTEPVKKADKPPRGLNEFATNVALVYPAQAAAAMQNAGVTPKGIASAAGQEVRQIAKAGWNFMRLFALSAPTVALATGHITAGEFADIAKSLPGAKTKAGPKTTPSTDVRARPNLLDMSPQTRAILRDNRNVPFVKRILVGGPDPLAQSDRMVYPTVIEENGKLVDLVAAGRDPLREALARGDFIELKSDEEALRVSKMLAKLGP